MGEMVVDERLVQAAGKLVLLDRMLTKLHASGHKTLIFCQMTKMMDILEDYLEMRSWPCHRIESSPGRLGRVTLEVGAPA